MTTDLQTPDIQDTPFAEALSERYLAYALSTIVSRSLPDARDGLKPVHRRLLYAMQALKLDPDAGFKKCARIVGDVMGKFHPHGDQAIYDALVRLAQDFAQRYPLVDGQGNFGNVDGDNAAAMRYTEARLTPYAQAMLAGIEQDAVDFRETYDGEEREPLVLPAAIPNLLANGATGIAVGMATNIPPHNLKELCQALLHLIKHPNASIQTLLGLMPGPDFPTGGRIVEPADKILEAYRSGRGGFRLRARWRREEGRRGTYVIVVEDVPYQVAKGRVVEKIAELLQQRKLPLLADIRDESTDEVRLVLEPRSGRVDAEMLMEQVYRLSDLEVRVGLNMNALDGGRTPRVMNLREVMQAYLDHRRQVLERRARHRLEQIARRLDVLAGYLVAYLNLDAVIAIIREEDEPKAALMARFDLNEAQAEAILNMRLRSLRRLEEQTIREEHAALVAERDALQALVQSEADLAAEIAREIRELRDDPELGSHPIYGPRRSTFASPPALAAATPEILVEREAITVICSEKGWLRSLRGHIAAGPDVRYKEGDRARFWLAAESTDKLLIFATNGRFYSLGCDRLPGGRGHGEPVRLLLDLGNDVDIVTVMVFRGGRTLLVASSDGRGFRVPEDEVIAQTRGGRQVLNVSGGIEAAVCRPIEGDHVAVVGDNHKMLVFPLSDLPEMSRGRGVILQRYRDGGLRDATTFNLGVGLSWQQAGGRTRTETDLSAWLGKRAASGRLAPRGFARNRGFD